MKDQMKDISNTPQSSALSPQSSTPPSAPSASSAVKPAVPESAEVQEASAANKRRQRQDALDDAAKILSVDLKNSCDVTAQACVHNQTPVIKEQWLRLLERVQRAGKALELAEQNQ